MRNPIVVLCTLAMLITPAFGQTTPDGGSTVTQGAVKRVVELVPSFNEVLWSDMFGAEYIENNSAIFVKQQSGGVYDLFPFRVVAGDMQLLPAGTYEMLYEEQLPDIDLFQGGNSFEVDGVAFEYDIDASFIVFAARLTGANGVSRIVTGFKYETVLTYTSHANTQYFIEQIVPLQRHLSEDEAISWAYLFNNSSSPVIDQSACSDLWDQCNANMLARRRLQENTLGIPWTGITAGGTAGGAVAAAIGGIVGYILGPAEPVVAVAGGGFGLIFGSITGGIIDHTDRMNNIGRRYRAGLSSCANAYDWCVEHGDWPTWGDSLLVPPQP